MQMPRPRPKPRVEERSATTSKRSSDSAPDPSLTVIPSASAAGGEAEDQPTVTGYTVERTSPDQLLRHDISDEELGILSDMRRDHTWEGMWASLALATGAAPNAIAAIWQGYAATPSVPIGAVDLIQTIFFFVGLVLAGVLFLITRSRAKTAADLVTEIRGRTPRHVQG